MSIFQDIASELGLPTGAIALAVGVVQGAKFLEKDASDRALKLFSDLITKADLKDIGKAGAGLVPFVFDKVFGPKPIGFRFISRSIIATTLFWLILLLLKRPNWNVLAEIFYWENRNYLILLSLWYILDWISISKARFLINVLSQRDAVFS